MDIRLQSCQDLSHPSESMMSGLARTRIAILIRANLCTYLNRMVLGVAEYARLKGTWTIPLKTT